MKLGQIRRRIGKKVYYLSGRGLVGVTIKNLRFDEEYNVWVALVFVGDSEGVDLEIPINKLIP